MKEQFIRKQIRMILSEGPDQAPAEAPKPKKEKPKEKSKEKSKDRSITRGSIGRGRVKDKIKEAKALASKDPQKLMKNLNIKGASGDTTPEKILSIVRAAIYGTEIMSKAYTGAALKKDGETGNFYINVGVGGIPPRDGALYMLHTVTGADNAGLLGQLDSNVEVGVKSGIVMIEFD